MEPEEEKDYLEDTTSIGERDPLRVRSVGVQMIQHGPVLSPEDILQIHEMPREQILSCIDNLESSGYRIIYVPGEEDYNLLMKMAIRLNQRTEEEDGK